MSSSLLFLSPFSPAVSRSSAFPSSSRNCRPSIRPSLHLRPRRRATVPITQTTMLTDTFLLRTSPRWLTIEPISALHPSHILYIHRSSLAISLRPREEVAALAEPDASTLIYGLVGYVETLHDAHLLVISKRSLTGSLMEHPVYRVDKLDAIPVRGGKMLKKMMDQLSLTKINLKEEVQVSSMLACAVALPGFYYSHAIDLTRSAQNRANATATTPDAPATPDFMRADMRFVWNRFAASKLANIGAVSWIVPLILGYVDVRTGLINGKSVQFALISRRAADRPGLRFTARGADVHGNCSNFVETEQIVSHGTAYSSYVQIRGSIPLLWKQEACIKYKPTPVIKQVDGGGKAGLCQLAFEKHFDSLFEHYGPVTAISLIENKGCEAILYAALNDAVQMMASHKLHFVSWDFHQKTKGMQYEKVDHELLPSIDSDLGAYSYFYTKDGTAASITKRQRGVVRTNCVDSLDRTNVVQSVIAHRIMDSALKVMGVLDSNPDTCSASKFQAFEKDFKNTWADHANALSQVYAGSGALKTDYTRTGKRSKPGMLQDGIRACRRYIYQNFLDGRRQDGIDIMLGVVTMPERSSLSAPRDLTAIKSKAEPLLVKEKYLPHLIIMFLVVASVGFFIIKAKLTKIIVTSVGFGAAGLFFYLMLDAGHKLVARPKLDGTH